MPSPDAFTKRLYESVSGQGEGHYVQLPGAALSLGNRKLAEQSQLDVMVYSGVGMNADEMAWAFARVAPVQLLFWGHPHTSGLDFAIDYFVSSELFHRSEHDDGGIAPNAAATAAAID